MAQPPIPSSPYSQQIRRRTADALPLPDLLTGARLTPPCPTPAEAMILPPPSSSPSCQFNLTRLQERIDLIKSVAVSVPLRGPSVSPPRLRLDSDNYFLSGYCLPPPPPFPRGARGQSNLLGPKNRCRRIRGGKQALAAESPSPRLTWPCLRLSRNPEGGERASREWCCLAKAQGCLRTELCLLTAGSQRRKGG